MLRRNPAKFAQFQKLPNFRNAVPSPMVRRNIELRLTRRIVALDFRCIGENAAKYGERDMELARKVNLLLVCAAFIFVGAMIVGVL